MKLVAPASLEALISPLRACFPSKCSFELFERLLLGQAFCLQGPATVTGLLTAAGHAYDGDWSRYHEFFNRVDWDPDVLGLAVARMIVQELQPTGVLRGVGDGTFFKRYGKDIADAFYQHDPHQDSGAKGKRTAYGHGWVIMGLLVEIPGAEQRVCLPVLFRLAKEPPKPDASADEQQEEGEGSPSCSEHAAEELAILQEAFADREFQLTVDAGFTVKELHGEHCVAITRLPSNARLYTYEPAPARTGKPGRPRESKYRKLPSLAELAEDDRYPWRPDADLRDGSHVKIIDCTRSGSLGEHPVRVIIVRETGEERPFTLALLCTSRSYSPEQIRAGYRERWGFETCMQEDKYVGKVGQQQSHVQHAVERAVPFGFLVMSLLTLWYATTAPDERMFEPMIAEPAVERTAVRRAPACPPWYNLKRSISLTDILVSFREEALAESFQRLLTAHTAHRTAANVAYAGARRHPPWLSMALCRY